MSRWFRAYDDVVNDPKVQRLAPHVFKAWFNLLCLANKAGNGVLPPVSDIAYHLRMSENDAQAALDELILCGLIDIQPDKSLIPHNWAARQAPSDSSRERTKKWRSGKSKNNRDSHGDGRGDGGDGNGDALDQTRQESESESESDQMPLPAKVAGSDFSKPFLVGVGSQATRSISIDAKRKVSRRLAISDCENVVQAFLDWDGSHNAKDIDAMFISQSEKFFKSLPEHVRRKLSLTETTPEPLPPIRASSSLKQLIGD